MLRYLGAVSQSLNFHLGEMVGLARAGDRCSAVLQYVVPAAPGHLHLHRAGICACTCTRYPVLGVTEGVVEAALSQAQAFWAKGVELQQVGRGAREVVEKRHVRR